MQQAKNALFSVGAAVATKRLVDVISHLGVDDVLRPMGLSRRRRRWLGDIALLGAGVVVGGITLFLLAPAGGDEPRRKAHGRSAPIRDGINGAHRPLGDGEAWSAHEPT